MNLIGAILWVGDKTDLLNFLLLAKLDLSKATNEVISIKPGYWDNVVCNSRILNNWLDGLFLKLVIIHL